MFLPPPSMIPNMGLGTFIQKWGLQLEGLDKPIKGGIAIVGYPANYGLVWEFGSTQMEHPGPKTLWSTNPLGRRAILTKQAPLGYITIHNDEMFTILKEELATVKFKSDTEDGIRLEVEIALDNANQRIARLISDSAPVDTGALRSSIVYVEGEDMP